MDAGAHLPIASTSISQCWGLHDDERPYPGKWFKRIVRKNHASFAGPWEVYLPSFLSNNRKSDLKSADHKSSAFCIMRCWNLGQRLRRTV